MKTAIEIIRDALSYIGVVRSGKPVNGDMSREALVFLNEVIYRLNSDNYFPFTNNTLDGKVEGGIGKIGPGDECVFRGDKPLNVNKVLVRYGGEWAPLMRLGYDNIWEHRCGTDIPTYYAFSNDQEGNGVLTFDSERGSFDCRVIYNRDIPAMDFNDVLTAPPQYEQLLKYGVAIKCCNRYGLPPDRAASIEKEYDSILSAIKKNNSFKHEIDRPINVGAYDNFELAVLSGRHL